MTAKHFKHLALAVRLVPVKRLIAARGEPRREYILREALITELCTFCHRANPRFNEAWFRGYIAGTCGPRGGRPK